MQFLIYIDMVCKKKHRLIEAETFAPLSLKEVKLGNFQKINIKEAIAMVKS